MPKRFYLGLDLGQAGDYTAVAVLERPDAPQAKVVYALRHLQRFPLGTAYTDIVPAVAELAGTPPLAGACVLAVDQTGVGRPLVDMLRKERVPCRIVPVTITAGHAATRGEDGSHHVPKRELVTSLQLLLQAQRLRVPRSLPDADVLARELENFRVKITASANEVFGAWREGQHDDLVLAVALAAWLAERNPPRGPNAITAFGGTIVSRMPPGVFLTDRRRRWPY